VKLVVVTKNREYLSIHRTLKQACDAYGVKPQTAYTQMHRKNTETYTSKTGITLTKTELK
jgi:hypothetical protein